MSTSRRSGVRVLVTGAGGFIGHHLVTFLKEQGYWVRGVDLKHPEYAPTAADEFEVLDLRRRENCLEATRGVEEVYALAADMGGMGFISSHHAQILHNNILISTHTLDAARENGVRRYLYTSSACVYPEYRQVDTNVEPLREEQAYPAAPQDAYGWEKLVTERLCAHYREDYGLETRTVRFHNIFGPLGTWDGGREKAPAALCRKVAVAKLTGNPEVEIWGDGEQTRSFCYIDDCVEGIFRLMRSDYHEPLNLGQDRLISINELADLVARVAGISIVKKHVPGPQGVRGRNSDNSRLREVLGWEPQISLEEGLARTYPWIEQQVVRTLHPCGRDRAGGPWNQNACARSDWRGNVPFSAGDFAPERVNVLGVGVSAITMARAVDVIEGWVAAADHQYVCVTGVHGVMESQDHPELRDIHNCAGLVTPDGMPLVWLSRLKGYRHVERVYGPDLMLACCAASVSKGYRHLLLWRSTGCARAPRGQASGALSRTGGSRNLVAAVWRAHAGRGAGQH